MQGASVLAGSTVIGQVLAVAATPVLTRLYSPDEYGLLSVYSSILLFALSVASARYEFAVPLPLKLRDAVNIVAVCFLLLFISCAFSLLAVWLFGDSVSLWTEMPELKKYLWLLPASLFGAGAYQILNYWAIRAREYRLVGKTKLMQSTAMIGTQLAVGYAAAGPIGLVLGDVAGRSSGGLTLLHDFLRVPRRLSLINWRGMKSVAYRYRLFPYLSSGASFLNVLGLQLPAVLIAGLYSPYYAGLYAIASRIGGLPADLVAQAIGQVYVGEASEALRLGESGKVQYLTSAIMKRLGLVALILSVFAFGGSFLFGPVFGSEWEQAGVLFSCLIPAFIGRFTVSPVSQITNIAERQGVQATWDAVRAIAVVGSFIIPSLFAWDVQLAVLTYGFAMAAVYAISGIVYLRVAKHMK